MNHSSTATFHESETRTWAGPFTLIAVMTARSLFRALEWGRERRLRHASRRDLARLSDRTLADLGMNRPIVAVMASAAPADGVRIARCPSMA